MMIGHAHAAFSERKKSEGRRCSPLGVKASAPRLTAGPTQRDGVETLRIAAEQGRISLVANSCRALRAVVRCHAPLTPPEGEGKSALRSRRIAVVGSETRTCS